MKNDRQIELIMSKLCVSCNDVAAITFHHLERLGVSQNFTEFCRYLLLQLYANMRNF